MSIGVLGGTFNPIHIGHLILAQDILNELNLSKVLFIPTKLPPHKKNVEDKEHRYKMVELAIKDNPHFFVSDIELKYEGISYTVKTLEELKKTESEKIFFIIGSDNLSDFPNWHRYKEIFNYCSLAVGLRPGYSKELIFKMKNYLEEKHFDELIKNFFAITPIGISSYKVRKMLKEGKSIKYLVPYEIEKYIIDNGLYRQPCV